MGIKIKLMQLNAKVVRLNLILFLFLFPQAIFPTSAFSATEQIHESILAGTWYSARPNILRNQLGLFFERAQTAQPGGKLVGLVVPHAGYRYSGQVAAHAYKLLKKHTFKTIVILAPSHHIRFKGVSVYDRGGYRTPLGVVSLNHDLIASIKNKNPDVRYVAEAHLWEHSLEIQLPFLQVVAPGAKLVPLVMGEQGLSACQKIAQTLAECVRDRSVLLVASTDLSHFHTYEQAKILDRRVIKHVRRMNSLELSRDLASGAGEACGGGPMMAVMIAAGLLGANHTEILNAVNSGDVTGDHSRVVGYMAAAFWSLLDKSEHSIPQTPVGQTTGQITPEDRPPVH